MNEPTSHSRPSLTTVAAPRPPLIELTFSPAGQLCFRPPGVSGAPGDSGAGESAKPDPMALPSIPVSITFWLMTLSDVYRQRSGLCMAALLLFDPAARVWGIGLPRQHCAPDSVCWSLGGDDPVPPGVMVAGSWQLHANGAPDELASLVPNMQGIHFVAHIPEDDSPCQVHAFLRVGEVTHPISPAVVTSDDWLFALDEAADRMIAA